VSCIQYKIMATKKPATATAVEIRTNLADVRTQRGIGAAELASQVGISRQTVYAIEAGTYVPNTAVSLRLARALDATVEELFEIADQRPVAEEILEATIIGEADSLEPGQPVRVCLVGKAMVAAPAESTNSGLSPADGVLLDPVQRGKQYPTARVRIVSDKWKSTPRLMVAGCDPNASILAHAMVAQGCELIVAYENSARALELLRADLVHIAGTHLGGGSKSDTDLGSITKIFRRDSVLVFSYAVWEEGLVIAAGNPKRIAGIVDLARHDVRFINREPGAGCRRLLDDLLAKHHLTSKQIEGYDRLTAGHLAGARLIRSGEVDCCVSTRAVARALALDFIPLTQKTYHLVLRRQRRNETAVQILLETVGRVSFRREVESCTGYDMRSAGNRLL
jgi:putative molybdopterin biosynthesis protein